MSENDFPRHRKLDWLRILSAAATVAGGATALPVSAAAPACQPWAAGTVYTADPPAVAFELSVRRSSGRSPRSASDGEAKPRH